MLVILPVAVSLRLSCIAKNPARIERSPPAALISAQSYEQAIAFISLIGRAVKKKPYTWEI
jgi:hypothetical protein